jgi:hypothetical protein
MAAFLIGGPVTVSTPLAAILLRGLFACFGGCFGRPLFTTLGFGSIGRPLPFATPFASFACFRIVTNGFTRTAILVGYHSIASFFAVTASWLALLPCLGCCVVITIIIHAAVTFADVFSWRTVLGIPAAASAPTAALLLRAIARRTTSVLGGFMNAFVVIHHDHAIVKP